VGTGPVSAHATNTGLKKRVNRSTVDPFQRDYQNDRHDCGNNLQ
jgi:hypothetical protein